MQDRGPLIHARTEPQHALAARVGIDIAGRKRGRGLNMMEFVEDIGWVVHRFHELKLETLRGQSRVAPFEPAPGMSVADYHASGGIVEGAVRAAVERYPVRRDAADVVFVDFLAGAWDRDEFWGESGKRPRFFWGEVYRGIATIGRMSSVIVHLSIGSFGKHGGEWSSRLRLHANVGCFAIGFIGGEIPRGSSSCYCASERGYGGKCPIWPWYAVGMADFVSLARRLTSCPDGGPFDLITALAG